MASGQTFSGITDRLKTILGEAGMTYRELAKLLQWSESSVKKLLNAKDGNVGRLDAICAALGVSLADVVSAAAENQREPIKLTDRQEQFLSEHPNAHALVEALANGATLSEVVRKYRLSPERLEHYGKLLQAIGLFAKSKDGEWRPAFGPGWILYKKNGPCGNALVSALNEQLMRSVRSQRLEDGERSPRCYSNWNHWGLLTTYSEFTTKARALLLEYVHRTMREKAIYPREKLVPISWMFLAASTEVDLWRD